MMYIVCDPGVNLWRVQYPCTRASYPWPCTLGHGYLRVGVQVGLLVLGGLPLPLPSAIDHYDTGVTPSAIYEINQLQAMQLADEAWKEVDATMIRQCWKKSGILPDIAPAIPGAAPPCLACHGLW